MEINISIMKNDDSQIREYLRSKYGLDSSKEEEIPEEIVKERRNLNALLYIFVTLLLFVILDIAIISKFNIPPNHMISAFLMSSKYLLGLGLWRLYWLVSGRFKWYTGMKLRDYNLINFLLLSIWQVIFIIGLLEHSQAISAR